MSGKVEPLSSPPRFTAELELPSQAYSGFRRRKSPDHSVDTKLPQLMKSLPSQIFLNFSIPADPCRSICWGRGRTVRRRGSSSFQAKASAGGHLLATSGTREETYKFLDALIKLPLLL